ncbi:MAG: GNAT family N-acetyltransferase [Planctomycetes bacterium]|nr:GNAT family N-acetyltransferase [Planctomycetota bacterium]
MPILETERLILRALRQDDLDAYASFVADPEVTRFLGDGRTLDRAQSWRQIAMFLGHWELRGFGMWGVELRSTGEFVGRVGLHEPEGWPGTEVGWLIGPPHQGNGYATESGRAAIEFAWRELGRSHLLSLIRPENVASIRVAERLGARFDRRIEMGGLPVAVFRLDRV